MPLTLPPFFKAIFSSGMEMSLRFSFVLTIILSAGCDRPPDATAPTNRKDAPGETLNQSTEVLATYEPDGSVTRHEVDALILSLPENERTPGESSFEEWYARRVEEVFISKLLLAEAASDGIEKESLLAAELRLLKQVHFTDAKIRSALHDLPPLGEKEILERYERRKSAFEKPETRLIAHIFLRFEDDTETSRERVIEKLESVRKRVEKGENFGVLAREISQSETRHRNGVIGTIQRGELSEPADSLVFSLAEGRISEPLVTQDGAHLFFNENTIAASSSTLEDVRSSLLREATFERKHEALAKLASECKILAPHFFPDESELQKLMESEDGGTVVLALGTYELTLDELIRLVRASESVGASGAMGAFPAFTILTEVKNREIVYQSMLASGGPEVKTLEESFEKLKSPLLIEAQRERKMTDWLEENSDMLRESYRVHQKRFQTRPRILLKGIRVPVTAGAPEKMARLEASIEELESGSLSFETLATELNGEASEWGWYHPDQLNRKDPVAGQRAFGMKVGSVSPPYRLNGSLNQFKLLDIEPPEIISFEQALPKVVELAIKTKGPEIYQKVKENLLESRHFQIFPQHFPSPSASAGIGNP